VNERIGVREEREREILGWRRRRGNGNGDGDRREIKKERKGWRIREAKER
jgi:hypothetical protein